MIFICDEGLELSFQNEVLSNIMGLELRVEYQDESSSGL